MSEQTITTTTPYNAAKAVNAVLEARGIVNPKTGEIKVVPSQMFYNYTTSRIREGKQPLIACDSEGRILVSALQEWVKAYVFKLENKTEEAVPVLSV